MNGIEAGFAAECKEKMKNDPDVYSMQSRIEEKGIRNAAFQCRYMTADFMDFDIRLPESPVTNQGISGRCWIYAAMNVINTMIASKNQFRYIQLSEDYIAFYDLLEKANYFLSFVIKTIKSDVEERHVWTMRQQPIQDAGQWYFLQHIIEKYGIITKEAMPLRKAASKTSEMIDVLSDMLREFESVLRNQYESDPHDMETLLEQKQTMLYRVYRFLVMSLGEPPSSFSVKLKSIDENEIIEKDITPLDFYRKYVSWIDCNHDFCSLVNIPLRNKPFYQTYSVKYLGNVWGLRENSFLNLPMNVIKRYIVLQLEHGVPVWIGCDSAVFPDTENGIYATENYNLKVYGFQDLYFQKGYALQFGLTRIRHAMAVVGVSFDKQRMPSKWLVKNSYGSDAGHNGYILMTDEWFSLYVYQAVIKKELLDTRLLQMLKKNTISLDLWDVLGSLAD